VVLALLRIVITYNVYSHTFDEPVHLAAGLEWWTRGTYTYDVQHPPLARALMAAGPYVAGARTAGEASVWREGGAVLRSGVGYDDNLWLARFGVLPFFLLACWAVWWWGRRLGSEAGGAFAAVTFTLVPAVVGHAGLATTDMPLVGALLALCAAWVVWLERPHSLGRSLWLGAAGGVALATKYSAIPYFAAAALASLVIMRPWRAGTWRDLARGGAVAIVLALALLFAAYRFDTDATGPIPAFFTGLGQLRAHNAQGHFTYLLGDPSTTGRLAFFPVVLAVKTPIALWVLMLIAGAWAVQGWRRSRWRVGAPMVPLLMALGVLGVAMTANINAGVRHILPVYAFMAVLVGTFIAQAWEVRRITRNVAAVLLGALLIESTISHPDELAYFNALVPNEPGRVLVDSDLDWGQDLHRLRDTVRARRISQLALAYYGSTDYPRDVLPPLRPVSRHVPDTGWVAISETYYRMGAISNPGGVWVIDTAAYQWLRQLDPVARVGKSIRLYRVSPLALPR
jgi:hypothetical protein